MTGEIARLTAFIVGLHFLAVGFDANVTARSTEDHIQVQVKDFQTEEPVVRAGVALYHEDQRIDSVLTDERGFAEVALLTTDASPEEAEVPASFEVSENYPNPFIDETRVDVTIPEDQTVSAEVYDILGQRVMSRNLNLDPGTWHLDVSLTGLAVGVYVVRISGREQHSVTITKQGRHSVGSGPGPGPSLRVSGGGETPVRVDDPDHAGDFSYPAGKYDASRQETTSEHPYKLRVGKEGYASREKEIFIDDKSEMIDPVEVALRPEHRIELVTVDNEGRETAARLKVTGNDINKTVETPGVMNLPAGTYRAAGTSEMLYFEARFKAHADTSIQIRSTGSMDGVALQGDEQMPVEQATRNLHIPVPQREEEISEVSDEFDEWQVLRTELEITFDPEATVGEVNALLEEYDAGIVSMLEGLSLVVIRFPDPGNMEALHELKTSLESEDIVFYTLTSPIIEQTVPVKPEEERRKLPDGINHFERIDHHLAVRGHAAWNARQYLQDHGEHPWLVIADLFGAGAPVAGEGYDTDVNTADFGTSNAHHHGYHVLGIITGSFSPDPFALQGTDDVTGIFPDELNVRGVDLRTEEANTWPKRKNQIINRIEDILEEDPDARIIVNTSLNSRGDYGDDQNNAALSWIQRVRGGIGSLEDIGAGLEDNFLHFTSAGNAITGGGDPLPLDEHWIAEQNSMFAYSALGDLSVPWVFDGTGDIPNLFNTFVVENRKNTENDFSTNQRPLPSCANPGSVMQGTLSGIGTEVWSFTATWPGKATGTSMATPQAAGTAAFAWSLDPDLSVLEIKELIEDTAEERPVNSSSDFDCNAIYPQPVVDAYSAVLQAGGADVRQAILDVNQTGTFDEDDIASYLDAFDEAEGELDYSRYDLNATGRTGGEDTDRFDLSMNGYYELISFEAQGFDFFVDESSLRDIDILCYYAYSSLFEGDEQSRDDLLDGPCGIEERKLSPIAVDDQSSVFHGDSVDIEVLVNDYNPTPGEDFSIHEITDTPSSGSVEIINDGQAIRYYPHYGFSGVVDFEYTIINEGGFESEPATVSVNVWSGMIPFNIEIADDVFGYIDIARINEARDAILSGILMEEIEASMFVDRHGIGHEIETLGGDITRAESLNRDGVVVGASENEDDIEQPIRWEKERETQPLPLPEDEQIASMKTSRQAATRTSDMKNHIDTAVKAVETWLPSGAIALLPSPDLTGEAEVAGQETVYEAGFDGNATDINKNGVIAGHFGPYAMLWHENSYFNLTDHLDRSGFASSVNSSNRVTGSMMDPETGRLQGFVWYHQDESAIEQGRINRSENDSLIILGSFKESTTMTTSINDAGHVTGFAMFEGEIEPDRTEPFIWTPEHGMVSTGTLDGDNAVAFDINNNRQIVGAATRRDGRSVGFLWMNGEMYDINELLPEESYTVVALFDISDDGTMSAIVRDDEGKQGVRILEPDVTPLR